MLFRSDRQVDLEVLPVQTPEAHATLNSVGFVIAAGQELERARLAREERLTLWPVDELPAEGDDSIVAGKMRDVMIYARKIAPTNVTVLVTGESGTGKEVMARALHRYSNRANKPFVPFNCTRSRADDTTPTNDDVSTFMKRTRLLPAVEVWTFVVVAVP